MLLQILRNVFTGRSSIVFVCATRLSKEDFWKKSAMGLSLKRSTLESKKISWSISFENTEGLPAIYNRAIRAAAPHEIIIFAHDDIWIDIDNLPAILSHALREYSVCGVAGTITRIPKQPSWIFHERSEAGFVLDTARLSGKVSHGKPGNAQLSEYGPWPADCELLDGVFLAASAKKLRRHKMTFDEQFRFHFYDLDFCRSARLAGLRIGTWPITLIHESAGDFGGPDWQKMYDAYLRKWKS